MSVLYGVVRDARVDLPRLAHYWGYNTTYTKRANTNLSWLVQLIEILKAPARQCYCDLSDVPL